MESEKQASENSTSPEILNLKSKTFRLKKQFGIIYSMAVITGLMIGSGIFLTPQTVMENAGSPGLTLIVWMAAGLNAILGSLVSAEIGLYFPVSGGVYTYFCKLYNPFFGVLYIWFYLILLKPASDSLKLTIFARYLLKPLYGDCDIPQLAILTLASASLFLISVLNCMNVKIAARTQSFLTFSTLTTLIFIICFGIYHVVTNDSIENFDQSFKHSCASPGCIVFAFYGASFSYLGWSALNNIIEEVKNPSKTLPTAILLSTSLITILYVTVNFAYLAVLQRSEILSSQAIAITMIMKFSTIGGWILSIPIAFAAYSSCNSAMLIGSRVTFAGSRNGSLPKCFSYINIKYVSPMIAVIISNILTLLLFWTLDVKSLINNIIFCHAIFELLLSVGYLKHRIIGRNREFKNYKNFKMPLAVHITYSILAFIIALIPLIENFTGSIMLFIIVLASSTIYYHTFVKERLKFKWIKNISDKVDCFVQKVLYCSPEERDD